MAFQSTTSPNLRVLICDDNQEQYKKIKLCLAEDNIECSKRIKNEDELLEALRKANENRNWYDFVMIDIDLRESGEVNNGIQVYFSVVHEYPDETYIIYSSQDIDEVRKQINRLMYRDVQLVLLDEVINKNNIRYHLNRLIQAIPRNRLFLVHGRNHNKRDKITKLLKDYFRLEIVQWEDARERAQSVRNYIYDIVMKGIEMSHLTLVLFTDDEEVELRNKLCGPDDHERRTINMKRRQSRSNVYIEAGYAMGIRPNRTIFIEWPDRVKYFESPSDFAGMHTIRYKDTPEDRETLKRRLEAARCKFEPKRGWKTSSL